MSTSIDHGRAVWQWQFSTQGEQTIAAVGATLRTYAGAGTCWLKAMDGAKWQVTYDSGPNAIASLASWKATVSGGQKAGISVLPWVVAQSAAQATIHAQLGPRLMVDLEDDPKSYWSDDIARIPGYFQALRAAGVSEIHVAIDPRPYHVRYLNVAAWAPYVDAIHTQSYWTDFQTPALSNVGDVAALLQLCENVYPILPYNGSAADLTAFWNACKALGCQAVSLWRLGSASAAQLQAFAALDVAERPAPDDQIQALQQAVAALTVERDAARSLLSALLHRAQEDAQTIMAQGVS